MLNNLILKGTNSVQYISSESDSETEDECDALLKWGIPSPQKYKADPNNNYNLNKNQYFYSENNGSPYPPLPALEDIPEDFYLFDEPDSQEKQIREDEELARVLAEEDILLQNEHRRHQVIIHSKFVSW
jgi:hypothetical protein